MKQNGVARGYLLQLAQLLYRLIILYRQQPWERTREKEQRHNFYRNVYGGR